MRSSARPWVKVSRSALSSPRASNGTTASAGRDAARPVQERARELAHGLAAPAGQPLRELELELRERRSEQRPQLREQRRALGSGLSQLRAQREARGRVALGAALAADAVEECEGVGERGRLGDEPLSVSAPAPRGRLREARVFEKALEQQREILLEALRRREVREHVLAEQQSAIRVAGEADRVAGRERQRARVVREQAPCVGQANARGVEESVVESGRAGHDDQVEVREAVAAHGTDLVDRARPRRRRPPRRRRGSARRARTGSARGSRGP